MVLFTQVDRHPISAVADRCIRSRARRAEYPSSPNINLLRADIWRSAHLARVRRNTNRLCHSFYAGRDSIWIPFSISDTSSAERSRVLLHYPLALLCDNNRYAAHYLWFVISLFVMALRGGGFETTICKLNAI